MSGSRRRLVLSLLVLFGCAQRPSVPVPILPPDLFGTNGDPDVGAINLAYWAYADPARTRNDPVDAARAVIAVEYLAPQLASSPRWAFVSPLTIMEMRQARAEVRAAVGIAPDAPPQEVVNRLVYVANMLLVGNVPGAESALQPPVFLKSPAETIAILSALPMLREANIATTHAAGQIQPGGSSGIFIR